MSLPDRFRPLPGRHNLVLSRSNNLVLAGAIVHDSLDSALSACKNDSVTHVWIIGGCEVYRAALSSIEVLHVTWIESEVEGDVKFPDFNLSEWSVVSEQECMSELDEFPTTYAVFKRSDASTIRV